MEPKQSKRKEIFGSECFAELSPALSRKRYGHVMKGESGQLGENITMANQKITNLLYSTRDQEYKAQYETCHKITLLIRTLRIYVWQ